MYLEKIFSQNEMNILKSNALNHINVHVTLDDLKNKGFIIFGAGSLGLEVYNCIKNIIGLTPSFFIDNKKAGNTVDNIPIYAQNKLQYINTRKYVILCSGRAIEMLSFCKKITKVIPILPGALRDFCFCPGEIGCHYSFFEKKEVYEAYKLLSEHESMSIFKDFILFHTTLIPNLASHYDNNTYFSSSLKNKIDYSKMVDCGAFTGDTLKMWIKNTQESIRKKYYAFEPNDDNFSHLEKYVLTLDRELANRIELFKLALSDKQGYGSMSLSDVLSRIDLTSSDKTVELCTIDNFFHDKSITIIKADVEGFEKEVLNGARKVIKEQRPSLIISAYHYPEDIYSIILLINSLTENYDFFFRLHLPYFGDVTLYAIPQK